MDKAKNSYILFGVFLGLIGVSFLTDFNIGIRVGENFWIFAWDMLRILPPAFLLIGIFEVWANRKTIESSFGSVSGPKRYVYAILLAATTVGGTFVAFPVANALYHKGADYNSIFTYVTAASLVMIPMSIMEASILGVGFTAVRLGVSLPLVIISSALLGLYFKNRSYVLPKEATSES